MTKGLSAGDRAVDFTRPDREGAPQTLFERMVGAPFLLVVVNADHAESWSAALDRCGQPSALLIKGSPQAKGAGPLRLFDDGAVSTIYLGERGGDAPTVFVIDGVFRVRARIDGPLAEAMEAARIALASIDALTPIAPGPIRRLAPCLLIPDVFDAGLCDALIAAFYRSGGDASGMLRPDGAGGAALRVDPSAKMRRDARIADSALDQRAEAAIAARVLPEILRAVSFRVAGREAFKLVRYAAEEGGYFRPHRDNTTPDAARRRFAMTINLNGGYEGGGLRFPEYGPEIYAPPKGGAIVFSCSLLHEATDVVRGARYALLTFFTGASR